MEGRRLAEQLASDARYRAVLSFAGRTRSLQLPDVPTRVGGFGGAHGLAEYLRTERIHALVDATHAFAAQISANAVHAASVTQTPCVRLARMAWQAEAGDRFIEVSDMQAAAATLAREPRPRRVFLSVGRLEVAAFAAAPAHRYTIRAVDMFDPGLPHARVFSARGPFDYEAELALLRAEQIELIVSKNSGTPSTWPKIAAARALGLPVILVQQPPLPKVAELSSLEAIHAWLACVAHQVTSSMRRGV